MDIKWICSVPLNIFVEPQMQVVSTKYLDRRTIFKYRHNNPAFSFILVQTIHTINKETNDAGMSNSNMFFFHFQFITKVHDLHIQQHKASVLFVLSQWTINLPQLYIIPFWDTKYINWVTFEKDKTLCYLYIRVFMR